MPQVRVMLSDEVHDLVRVEAALRKESIARTVAMVVAECLEGQAPREGDTPETVAAKVEQAKAIMAQAQAAGHYLARGYLPSWVPASWSDPNDQAVAGWQPRDFSKAAQATKKKGKP